VTEAAPDPNVHDCRQGPRCAMRTTTPDGTVTPCGTEHPNSLCPACEMRARTAAAGLHIDWRELWLSLPAHQSTALNAPIGGTREAPIPIRTGVDACMTDIETELVRWCRILTGGDNIPTGTEDTVRFCLSAVLSRMPTLIHLPPVQVVLWVPLELGGDDILTTTLDGVDAVLRLAALHHQAQHLVGATHVTRWLDHQCPTCRTRTLKVTDGGGESTTSCVRCHRTWADHELDRWDAMQPALAKADRV
jgi:hypothetical protein